MKNVIALLIACGMLTACTSTGNSNKYQAQVGSTMISWKQFDAPHLGEAGETTYMVTRLESAPVVLSNGMSIPNSDCMAVIRQQVQNAVALYNECNEKVRNRPAPSLQRFIAEAEQVIRADGRCTWLGYDQGFDFAVRAEGQLASLRDERLFFTRMRCDG